MRNSNFLLFVFFLSMGCAYGQKKGAKDSRITLRNLSGINTKDSEFSPAFYGNGVVYVSRLRQGPVDEASNQRYFDLFFSEISESGQSFKPELFSIELNSPLHEGPATFSRDLSRVYFTRSNQKNGISKQDTEGIVRLAIYEAERGFFDWENVRELPFNSPDYSCMHPALSPDGKKLFFASNKPGGYGGTDLYFAEKIGDNWSPAINLGPEINTSGNEAYPFYHDSGVLFFSSNQHEGEGGLDIFAIDISSNIWGKVIHLEKPFNSAEDDFGFILDETGKKGYFSSNRRDGYGSDDIYSFEAPETITGLNKPQLLETRIIAKDLQTEELLEGVAIWIFETDASGKIKDRSNYDFQLVNDDTESSTWKLDLVRKSLQEIGKPTLVSDTYGSGIYDFLDASHYLLVASKAGYDVLEKKVSVLEGLYDNPFVLSMQQTSCIPLRASVSAEDTGDAVSGAQVEIIRKGDDAREVIKTASSGFFDYCLEPDSEYLIRISGTGFETLSRELTTSSGQDPEPLALQFFLKAEGDSGTNAALQEGSVIVLEDIYYDFNQSAIRSGQVEELEALAGLMFKYPGMKIELAAHTDTRGTAAYNQQLSEKRAASTKRYLVNKGIAAFRIQTVGYGESFPRNHCLDGISCSEEEHAFNRRTEIKVISMGDVSGQKN